MVPPQKKHEQRKKNFLTKIEITKRPPARTWGSEKKRGKKEGPQNTRIMREKETACLGVDKERGENQF